MWQIDYLPPWGVASLSIPEVMATLRWGADFTATPRHSSTDWTEFSHHKLFNVHCSDITWVAWRLKSLAIRSFYKQLAQASIKKNIIAQYAWLFESGGFPSQRDRNVESELVKDFSHLSVLTLQVPDPNLVFIVPAGSLAREGVKPSVPFAISQNGWQDYAITLYTGCHN